MTNPDYVAVQLVVDRSGSMWAIKEATDEAINAFIKGLQQGPGKRTIRTTIFDTIIEDVYPSTPVADVPEFVLIPRGGTALLDAIGLAATQFGEELAALPESERPGGVVFAIMTDGEENSSREWTVEKVRELLERQQSEWNWDVRFMGANIDAVETGAALGVAASNSITYSASSVGTKSVIGTMNDVVAYAAGPAHYAFTEDDREAAESE